MGVLEKPQQILPSSKGREIAQKTFKKEGRDFLIRVIFFDEGDRRKVITVYCTSKIDKYWRKDR